MGLSRTRTPFITSNSQEVSIIKDFYDSTGSSRVGGTADSEAWPSLLTGHEFMCESRPSLLSASVSHCKMMWSSWSLALFLCYEPTPSLRKRKVSVEETEEVW